MLSCSSTSSPAWLRRTVLFSGSSGASTWMPTWSTPRLAPRLEMAKLMRGSSSIRLASSASRTVGFAPNRVV